VTLTKNVVHLGLDVSEPLVALPSSDEVMTGTMPSVKQEAFICLQAPSDPRQSRKKMSSMKEETFVQTMTGISRTRPAVIRQHAPFHQTPQHRHRYFRLRRTWIALMSSAPAVKRPVHRVWLMGTSTEARRPSGLATIVLKKLQKVYTPEMTSYKTIKYRPDAMLSRR